MNQLALNGASFASWRFLRACEAVSKSGPANGLAHAPPLAPFPTPTPARQSVFRLCPGANSTLMFLAAAACLVPNIGRCGGYRVHMIAILNLDGDRRNSDHGVPAHHEKDIIHQRLQSSSTLTCIVMFPRTPQSPARPRPVSWALLDLVCSTPARGSRTSLTAGRPWPTVTTLGTPSSHPRISRTGFGSCL